jgi:UDP-N-acetyl-D-galactosamine dehydrogenase
MGLAFKEDCPDHRNTRVVDVVDRLRAYGLHVDVSDPWVDPDEAELEYGYGLVEMDPACSVVRDYDAVVLAVAHSEFVAQGEKVRSMLNSGGRNGVIFDVKGVWPRDLVDGRL